MLSFWMKLLGVKIDEAKHVTGHSLTTHGAPIELIVFLGIALTLLSFWMYRKTAEHVPNGKKYLLAALRSLFLLLVLFLLMRPVLAFTVEHSVRKTLVVLIDVSKSMSIADPRVDENDLKRVAIAKGDLDPGKTYETLVKEAKKENKDSK